MSATKCPVCGASLDAVARASRTEVVCPTCRSSVAVPNSVEPGTSSGSTVRRRSANTLGDWCRFLGIVAVPYAVAMIVSLIAGNSGSVLCLAVFSYNFILALVALASLIAGLYDPDFVLRPYQIELSRWQILLVFIPALALAIGLVSYTNSW